MRQFSEKDVAAIDEAEKQLRVQGKFLISDPKDGQENVDHNVERIGAYFTLNSSIPVTVETVLKAFDLMSDQLRWKSKAQVDYETAYNALSRSQQNSFGAWWFTQKHVLILEGDGGYDNAAAILHWMKGRSFDPRQFALAVSNLAATRGLHMVHQSSFHPGRHSGSDASFMKKSETNLTERDHATNRAADAAAASGNKQPAPTTDYRALAEAITTGRTHSDSEKLERMFVMKPATSDVDWEQTYSRRRKIADGKGR